MAESGHRSTQVPNLLQGEKSSANQKHHVGLLCEQEINLCFVFYVKSLTNKDLLLHQLLLRSLK